MNKILVYILLLSIPFASCRSGKNAVGQDGMTKEQKAQIKKLNASNLVIDGTIYRIRGDYENAVKSFLAALKIDPVNDAAMYNLSLIFSKTGQTEQALAFAKDAVKTDASNEWYLLHLCELYDEYKMDAEAVSSWEKLLKLSPRHLEYYFYCSNAYIRLNRVNESIEVLDRGEKNLGFDKDLVYQKYRLYSFIEKYPEAINELLKLTVAQPFEAEHYVLIGEIYLKQNKQADALIYFDKAIAISPNNGKVQLIRGKMKLEAGDEMGWLESMKIAFASGDVTLNEKLEILNTLYKNSSADNSSMNNGLILSKILTTEFPEFANGWSIRADFLMLKHDKTKALESYQEAIKYNPQVFAFWQKAILLASDMDEDSIMYSYSKEALSLFPEQALFYYYNGLSCYRLNKYQEAVEVLQTGKDFIIDDTSLLVQIYTVLGESYDKLKNYSKSDYYFESALKIEVSNTFLMNDYAYVLAVRNDKLDRAFELSEKCVAAEPLNPSFLDTYGWLFYRKGDYKKAEEYIRKAIDHGGELNGTILEHYGDVLFKQGMKNDAMNFWKQALKTGKHSEWLQKKIETGKIYE